MASALILCGSVPASGLECGGTLTVVPAAPGMIEADLALPCEPYASVSVQYGPLSFPEETDSDGRLLLALPSVGAARTLRVESPRIVLDAAVPPDPAAAPGLAAVLWSGGDRWGRLESDDGAAATPVGFSARDGGAPLDLLTLPAGARAVLVVPLTKARCGTRVEAQFFNASRVEALALTLDLPECDGTVAALRVPLP